MVDLCRRDDGKLNILLPGAALLGVRMVARLEEAGEEQRRANNILATLRQVGLMAGEKALMCRLGLDFGMARRPFRPLNEEEEALLWRVYCENV